MNSLLAVFQEPSIRSTIPDYMGLRGGEGVDGVAPLLADPPDATPPLCTEVWCAKTETSVLTQSAEIIITFKPMIQFYDPLGFKMP